MNIKTIKLLLTMSVCCMGLNQALAGDTPNAGVVAYNEARFKEAETYLLNNLQNPTGKNQSLVFLSRIYLENGSSEKAVSFVEQALSVEPNDAEEILLAGDAYCSHAQKSSMFSALKLAKKCVAQYEAAIAMAPENVEALIAATRFYISVPSMAGGSKTKGNDLLKRLEKLSVEDAGVLKMQLLESDGDTGAALVLADELSGKGFKSPINHYEVAHFYKQKKQNLKAKNLFESLVKRTPTTKARWQLHDGLLQLGEILLEENQDLQRSIALIEQYKQKNSNPQDIHYFWSTWSLAKAYKAAGNKTQYAVLVNQIKSEDYKRDKAFAKNFEENI